MLFSEPFFLLLFLPVTLAAYFAAPRSARNAVLCLASLVFYAVGEWQFLKWLIASIALNYVIARGIERTRGTQTASRLLLLGIATDLGLLIVFKYAGFIVESVDSALGLVGVPLSMSIDKLALPLGISFFTFHKISYKVDVYRGIAEAKKSPIDLALYILLFPQLIAGPIVRFNEIASELTTRRETLADFAAGTRRFILGLAKKMIIANTVGQCADRIFAIPGHELSGPVAWLGIVCYALQIYFDFSGYSDMAIGLARMFGFHFPENFDHPYVASSITEFWRRWHMSLSRWFRDYLYIPLGGNRARPGRLYINLVTVFFLCGLWHGASWNFVVWGMFHGLLLVVERLGLAKWLVAVPAPVRHVYALLMVLIGWVFFRAETLPAALGFLGAMVGLGSSNTSGVFFVGRYLDRELLLVMIIGVIASAPVRAWLLAGIAGRRAQFVGSAQRVADASIALCGTAALGALFVYSVMSMAAGTYNPFIYFRF